MIHLVYPVAGVFFKRGILTSPLAEQEKQCILTHPVISGMLSWVSGLGCLYIELQLTNEGWILFPDKAT